jgi:DNA-directed RNA polymerase specialized sigma24 family protein
MGELSVVDRARADAFDALMTHTQAALFQFARGLVGEFELARDIVQDAFVDAWRAAAARTPPFAQLDDEAGMRRWLYTVTYRHALKARTRRRIVVWEPLDAQLAQALPR